LRVTQPRFGGALYSSQFFFTTRAPWARSVIFAFGQQLGTGLGKRRDLGLM
jgi:hypothetical protein